MLGALFLNRVYYTHHLDIVSYPLVALCGMIVTLLDSCFFLPFLLVGYLCLTLSYGLTNEYISSVYFFIVASIFDSQLIIK